MGRSSLGWIWMAARYGRECQKRVPGSGDRRLTAAGWSCPRCSRSASDTAVCRKPPRCRRWPSLRQPFGTQPSSRRFALSSAKPAWRCPGQPAMSAQDRVAGLAPATLIPTQGHRELVFGRMQGPGTWRSAPRLGPPWPTTGIDLNRPAVSGRRPVSSASGLAQQGCRVVGCGPRMCVSVPRPRLYAQRHLRR
jgi:hypothetical protein